MTACADINALDVLCPMHLVLNSSGNITHAGPTAQKISPDRGLEGQRFFEVFEIRRPRAFSCMQDFQRAGQQKLHLRLRAAPRTKLKGIVVPAGDGSTDMIVNLSFGISVVDGVRDFSLTNADFAATDLAIEMLYLVEAKTAAMEASYRLNDRLQGAKMAAEEQADTDTLTGLRNRRALNTVLTKLLEEPHAFAVMQIDLDFFKAVNDSMGHAAGDHVLKRVAQIMREETRSSDTVARVGGDEFTLVLPNVRNDKILQRIGRRIIERLERPIRYNGADCHVSASIGTVWLQGDESATIEGLLSDADVALYASKNAGRSMQTLYRPELRTAANAVLPPAEKRSGAH